MQVIHTNKSFSRVALGIIVSLLFLCHGGVVSALTYQTTQNVEFTFNPTISVSLSSNDLIIDSLTPNSSSDSNIITVSVSTNTGYGYYMSATAGTSTGDTNLTSTTNSGNVFTNLSSNAATLAAFPDDRWGYSYSTDNGSTWISGSQGSTTSGYNGLPLDNDDSGATGVILASTDSFSNSGSIKFKIGAKASATQATGTYTNTVNFYAVANPEPTLGPVECEAGKICYNVNSLTATEGTMGKQDATDGNTVTLLASNFSREGYGFAGWSDTYDYSGNLYGPQETITVPNGTTASGLSLYAIWMPSAGTMQANASSVCSGLTTASTDGTKTLASVSALTDQRDNQTYAIAKLADGKCWMIENLRLEANATRGDTNRLLSQGYGASTIYGNFSGLADTESTTFYYTDTYAANSLYYSGTQEGTASIDIGTIDYPASRMPRYNNLNTTSRALNPTSNTFAYSNTMGGMYSYGNYYTLHAAIANLAYNGTVNNSTASTSLCPTGWKLPQGGNKTRIESNNDNDFWNLIVGALNNNTNPAGYDSTYYPYFDASNGAASMIDKLKDYPNNFLYSGFFINSSAESRGSVGNYWSSTSDGGISAYYLGISDSLYPGTWSSGNNLGFSIRCVASGS